MNKSAIRAMWRSLSDPAGTTFPDYRGVSRIGISVLMNRES